MVAMKKKPFQSQELRGQADLCPKNANFAWMYFDLQQVTVSNIKSMKVFHLLWNIYDNMAWDLTKCTFVLGSPFFSVNTVCYGLKITALFIYDVVDLTLTSSCNLGEYPFLSRSSEILLQYLTHFLSKFSEQNGNCMSWGHRCAHIISMLLRRKI